MVWYVPSSWTIFLFTWCPKVIHIKEGLDISFYRGIQKIKKVYLIFHSDRTVQVTEDGTKGVYVRGGTLQRVTDAADCTTAFRKGWNARCQSQTDFGVGEAKSAIFFMLDISLVSFH